MSDGGKLANLIEALLFVQPEPFPREELKKALSHIIGREVAEEEIEGGVQSLRSRYEGSSIELICAAGGYALRTRPEYGQGVAEYLKLQQGVRLSRPLLETIAVVAYHQPVTRPFIQHVRGVQSDYAVERLLELELIEPAGRANLPGKPLTYRTTQKFLEVLGISSIEELPRLQDFSAQPPQIHPPQDQPRQMPQVGDAPHNGLPHE
ncbi:MAG: SMC-Scp complex subunit ScpB [Bacteroidia bacterium]|nr:SMC-Scp complex subunit ScpB [Bacteroidia bacterium]MDW8235315.1 SMC-Scp complex subunit ScpB [Bacteroidia bacterium]